MILLREHFCIALVGPRLAIFIREHFCIALVVGPRFAVLARGGLLTYFVFNFISQDFRLPVNFVIVYSLLKPETIQLSAYKMFFF